MLNIGYRPTLANGTERSIEVNIFDFSSDIYGKTITIRAGQTSGSVTVPLRADDAYVQGEQTISAAITAITTAIFFIASNP